MVRLTSGSQGRAFRAAFKSGESHDAQHLLQYGSVDIFRHDVGRIIGAKNLQQLNGSITDFLLAPWICDIKVSDLAKSTPTAYAHSRSGIGMDPNANRDSKIPGNGLHTQALSDAGGNPVEFRFSTRQRNRGLLLRPMFDIGFPK